jgi:MFS family permease
MVPFIIGTHLYVLYDGYGFSVASLYSLGFITGAVTTPLTGSLVDKFGRKTSAIWYCILEIMINQLEQYPFLVGLVVSRMIGGITTNLLSTVFEAWLDTEYRKRGLPEEKYEIIMRDSVIVSNLAAIASGYLAHILAENYGPVGPFKGAVSCTALALVVVASLWTENYGKQDDQQQEKFEDKSISDYVSDTVTVFRNDSKVLRVGIIQGFTVGCLQIFIFLWSPTLAEFAKTSNSPFALDSAGEPAYGLIFGAYMAAGVLGGLASSYFRKAVSMFLTPISSASAQQEKVITEEGEEEQVRPMAVEFMASVGYILCAALLFVPVMMDPQNEQSFSISLAAFLVFEFLVGVIMPCEGIIRSLYLPRDCRASIMTLPRMIVNIQVSLGVILTKSVTHQSAFAVIAVLMVAAASLQMSLISTQEWESLFARAEQGRRLSEQVLRRTSSALSYGAGCGTLVVEEGEKVKDE